MAMLRREFLGLGALATGAALLDPRLVLAGGGRGGAQRPRFVLIIMRGALDGLAAVPPYGDREYASLRREFALRAPGESGGALPLDGFFGLHPALAFLGQCYASRELAVLHAVASGYRERSHFDGQDVLENGTSRPHALQTGWLNRALAQLPGHTPREAGVALGQNVPLVLRGPAGVTSWSPSRLATPDDDTLARLADLYAGDALLARRLADALAAKDLVSEEAAETVTPVAPAVGTASAGGPAAAIGTAPAAGAASVAGPRPGASPQPSLRPGADGARYGEIVRAAAGFLCQEDGPDVAVFDTNGWDTHANEGGAQGQLAARLTVLDAALATLRQELAAAWRDTAVLLVTEFGRTAAINGTRGTDHGTATVALLAGGAVAGGRVIADWPGLSERALYQGRDLMPTLDLRSVLKGLLQEHLGVASAALERQVFPDSAAAKPLRGLLRA